ncbi:MAG: hypothetical protein WCF57_11650 [Pyrinomonadaceae bacterium]
MRLIALLLLALCLLIPVNARAQEASAATPTPQPAARGVIRLRVRPKIDGAEKGLSRKRFYLIRGTLQDHKSLLESIDKRVLPSRECYYSRLGASPELRKWLKLNNCDSVYCRDVEQKYVEGADSIPEFREAYQKGLKEFGSAELARKWITNNLREEIRDGYYNLKQETVSRFVKEAEATSKANVVSVMTDRKGTAYFTEVEPATYLITNIIPGETGSTNSILWICEYVMKPEKLGEEQIIKLSNQEDKRLKCRFVEKPPDPCAQAAN